MKDVFRRSWRLPIGATPAAEGTHFRVWAADAATIAVVLFDGATITASHDLIPEGDGYFQAHIPGVGPGARYMYRIDGGDLRPDPAARAQPESVHGRSLVVDPEAFAWSDAAWQGVRLEDLIIYELHVGTATPEGTFAALIPRLAYLQNLGVTAIELMPVADFPGDRNWGYDGVALFAPARAYGGPEGLKHLVDAAHAHGLAVLLDVVYNHLGPDGNYLRQFSHAYFSDRHQTPWGEALNFDGPDSGPVRDFFVANACYWAHEYHLDGLRLDATHAIVDDSPRHFLAELAERVRASLPPSRAFTLIAEDGRNDPRLVRPRAAGGYGLDGVWADDLHHQLRVALAGDRDGYYADYSGSTADIATTLRQGWFYTGQTSPSLGHPRGTPAPDVPSPAFVHCLQNHDQTGNRAFGERIHHQITAERYRAASVLLLLTPATPLLFMGQEWAASTPFQYFTDHNPELGRLVTEGRRQEFAQFAAFAGAEVPDPQDAATFQRSQLRWEEHTLAPHAGILRLYQDVLALRRSHPALRERARARMTVSAHGEQVIVMRRETTTLDEALLVVVQLGDNPSTVPLDGDLAPPAQRSLRWAVLLDSQADQYGGDSSVALHAAHNERQLLALGGARALVLTVQPGSA